MNSSKDVRADASITRFEEELGVGIRETDAGGVRIKKVVETHTVQRAADRLIEKADAERAPALEEDTGEIITYDDGSVSIPVYEERLVIEKRLVVKERVLIRKHTVTEHYDVEAELRRERLEVDADEEVADRVHGDGDEVTS